MSVMTLATVADLQNGWRTLTAKERGIAETLLVRASSLVLTELQSNGIKQCSINDLLMENCKTVVCDMVRYSMVSAQNMTSSLFGETVDSAMWEQEMEGGSLRLTEQHLRQLGVRKQTIGSIGYIHG